MPGLRGTPGRITPSAIERLFKRMIFTLSILIDPYIIFERSPVLLSVVAIKNDILPSSSIQTRTCIEMYISGIIEYEAASLHRVP